MRSIGIDLHTNSFTACMLEEGQPEKLQTLPLQGKGLSDFIKQLRSDDAVAFEATGNSAWFLKTLRPYVGRVCIVAPWQFEVIRRSVKKTDKHDARTIAFFLSKDMIPESRVKEESHLQLASLIATRDQLVKTRVSLINKVHGMFVRHGLKIKKATITTQIGLERALASHEWGPLDHVELKVIKDQLGHLHQGIKELEQAITQAAKALPYYENILSIKGIGPLSAAIFLCHIGNIKDFDNPGKLAAYFGITPRISQSNDSQRVGRITKRGNKLVRTTLVQCALIAKRYSPYLHSFYERLKKSRGSGKAIIATARKLLNTIYYTLKNNWMFKNFPNFELSPCNLS